MNGRDSSNKLQDPKEMFLACTSKAAETSQAFAKDGSSKKLKKKRTTKANQTSKSTKGKGSSGRQEHLLPTKATGRGAKAFSPELWAAAGRT
jgi:hypothetical protein